MNEEEKLKIKKTNQFIKHKILKTLDIDHAENPQTKNRKITESKAKFTKQFVKSWKVKSSVTKINNIKELLRMETEIFSRFKHLLKENEFLDAMIINQFKASGIFSLHNRKFGTHVHDIKNKDSLVEFIEAPQHRQLHRKFNHNEKVFPFQSYNNFHYYAENFNLQDLKFYKFKRRKSQEQINSKQNNRKLFNLNIRYQKPFIKEIELLKISEPKTCEKFTINEIKLMFKDNQLKGKLMLSSSNGLNLDILTSIENVNQIDSSLDNYEIKDIIHDEDNMKLKLMENPHIDEETFDEIKKLARQHIMKNELKMKMSFKLKGSNTNHMSMNDIIKKGVHRRGLRERMCNAIRNLIIILDVITINNFPEKTSFKKVKEPADQERIKYLINSQIRDIHFRKSVLKDVMVYKLITMWMDKIQNQKRCEFSQKMVATIMSAISLDQKSIRDLIDKNIIKIDQEVLKRRYDDEIIQLSSKKSSICEQNNIDVNEDYSKNIQKANLKQLNKVDTQLKRIKQCREMIILNRPISNNVENNYMSNPLISKHKIPFKFVYQFQNELIKEQPEHTISSKMKHKNLRKVIKRQMAINDVIHDFKRVLLRTLMLTNNPENESFNIIMKNKESLLSMISAQIHRVFDSSFVLEGETSINQNAPKFSMKELEMMRENIREIESVQLSLKNTNNKINRPNIFKNKSLSSPRHVTTQDSVQSPSRCKSKTPRNQTDSNSQNVRSLISNDNTDDFEYLSDQDKQELTCNQIIPRSRVLSDKYIQNETTTQENSDVFDLWSQKEKELIKKDANNNLTVKRSRSHSNTKQSKFTIDLSKVNSDAQEHKLDIKYVNTNQITKTKTASSEKKVKNVHNHNHNQQLNKQSNIQQSSKYQNLDKNIIEDNTGPKTILNLRSKTKEIDVMINDKNQRPFSPQKNSMKNPLNQLIKKKN